MLDDVIKTAITKRDCGVVRFTKAMRKDLPDDPMHALDALVGSIGFNAIGKAWVEIPSDVVTWFVSKCFHRDLAYDYVLMDLEEATLAGDTFVSSFSLGARYFTNGGLYKDFPGAAPNPRSFSLQIGWHPFDSDNPNVFDSAFASISDSTFDTGVVVLDLNLAAIIWFEDED